MESYRVPGPHQSVAQPPATPRPAVYVDGSWRQEVQRMGAAAVFRDAAGTWLSGISLGVDGGDAFIAELAGIELGLQQAWNLGHRELSCYSDCLEAVNVCTSHVDVTTYWARDAILRIRTMLQWGWNVELTHVPRGKNNAADCLAKHASREGAARREWRLPPSFVIEALLKDVVA
ncbi:uncharacterized protein LOC130745038 [Lotus japonicus]|uniref:uncharacterized protein LOC130745038 n=1 Tax=Lotus japonicus TaxID=34305 RepID=UPI0025867E84|nr:uncharacterized protein LOC130745038 [Lotus japonicus]